MKMETNNKTKKLNKTERILVMAMFFNDDKTVERVIEENLGEFDINLQDEFGKTLLIWSARYAYDQIFDKLLELGADLNVQDCTGRTALMECAINENRKGEQELVRAGAKLNLVDDYGFTATDYAEIHSNMDIAYDLKSYEKYKTFAKEKI